MTDHFLSGPRIFKFSTKKWTLDGFVDTETNDLQISISDPFDPTQSVKINWISDPRKVEVNYFGPTLKQDYDEFVLNLLKMGQNLMNSDLQLDRELGLALITSASELILQESFLRN